MEYCYTINELYSDLASPEEQQAAMTDAMDLVNLDLKPVGGVLAELEKKLNDLVTEQ